MNRSIKLKLIFLFSIIFLAILFPSNAFATISGTKSSNISPVIEFDTLNKRKLTNVVLYIKDGGSIKEYTVYYKNSSGEFVTAPSTLYQAKKEADNKIKITLLHSGMAGKNHTFRIFTRDNLGYSSDYTFLIAPKTENNVTYYALNCFPRITDFAYNTRTKKLSFKVTDNANSTTVVIKDVYYNTSDPKVISKGTSSTTRKTFSVGINNLTKNSGYYLIRINAKDKHGYYSTINVKFSLPTTSSTSGTTGANIVAYAKKYLGYKYVSGGSSPDDGGFDCSGFTKYVYNHFGITISRTSAEQSKNGVAVSKSNLKAGDLVFFKTTSAPVGHVGIYIGNNKFIHAANPKKGVLITSLSDSYYSARYVTARRILK